MKFLLIVSVIVGGTALAMTVAAHDSFDTDDEGASAGSYEEPIILNLPAPAAAASSPTAAPVAAPGRNVALPTSAPQRLTTPLPILLPAGKMLPWGWVAGGVGVILLLASILIYVRHRWRLVSARKQGG